MIEACLVFWFFLVPCAHSSRSPLVLLRSTEGSSLDFSAFGQRSRRQRRRLPLQDSLADTPPDEAPSIPIGACPNGVTEGTSVAFMCGNLANAV